MRFYGYDPTRRANIYRKHIAGPEPKATKKWHKVVVDIVTVLIVLGVFAWFFFKILM